MYSENYIAATGAVVAQKRLEAIKQANSYAADKHLQQRADAKGWALHKFVIVFSGWKLQLVEEV